MNTAFYAYVHMKPDLTPFYVGKGCGNRAYDLNAAGRNKWHKNIVAKHGQENIIVEIMECSSEKEAFFREIAMIRSLKEAGVSICNVTAGGAGGLTSSIENLSLKGKARYSNPEARKQQSDLLKVVSATAEFRNAVSAATKKAIRGEARQRHLDGLLKANASQSSEARSDAQLRSFAENHERIMNHSKAAKLVQQNMSDETRAAKAAKLTAANLVGWANPEIRAKRIAGMLGKKHVRESSKSTTGRPTKGK